MKLQAKIGGEKLDVEIVRDGSTVTATVDGREYTLEVSEPEPHVIALRNGNTRTEAIVSAPTKANPASKVVIAGVEFDVELVDPKRLRGSATAGDAGEGVAEIRTAMPGKVVRILVEAGAAVAHGDGVIVVEAMKMQNEMRSPKDGVVREIRAAEGENVNAGDVLVIID